MTEYITVSDDDRVEARNGVIKLHGPDAFEGMRAAGRLAAEILDALVPHVVPGVTTGELDDDVHDQMLRGGGGPGDARLSRLHQELLHLDQPCRLPRHPRRQALKDGDIVNIDVTPILRRLARRHQPHVSWSATCRSRRGSWSTSPTNA